MINKPITSIGSLTSSYNVTVPSSGAYNTSYDIWDTDYDYEIMLWVNHNGA
ncbi:Secreted sugar hydrolase OS=Streptomyces glaucescens OX=1907 GN=SGLAU_24490 PE=3 SV=1 [Streptomyces glaucescens]